MTTEVICVDASFVVRLATSETAVSPYRDLWNQWQSTGATKVAPTLFYYEVTNAVHRYVVAGQILPEEADQILEYILNLEITFYSEATLHRRALILARNLTLPAAYDAHYLALAEQLEADFYTADRRLFEAVHTTLPWVHLAT